MVTSGVLARRVKIWITPPTACEPYSADTLPRTISMRSISSIGRNWNDGMPKSARLIGTPSTSTSVCRLSPPRRNTLVCEPSGPVCAMSALVRLRNSDGRSVDCDCSISCRVITRVLGSASGKDCSVRAAVTTITWPASSPRAAADARARTTAACTAAGRNAARARREGDFMAGQQ